MTVSKKIRFEVFKRDGFKCKYCGRTPPEVTLEVDHLNPKSKGGADDINNLITSCFDCNRGKSHIPLQTIPNSLNENLDILKEKELQLKEYNKIISKIKHREIRDIEKVNEIFVSFFPSQTLSDEFKERSLKLFLKKLPRNEVGDAMHSACSYLKNPDDAVKYFCGICWRKIKASDPSEKVVQLWKGLSKYCRKGVGFFRNSDLDKLKNCELKLLEKYMIKALSSKSSNYWQSFMNLIKEVIDG